MALAVDTRTSLVVALTMECLQWRKTVPCFSLPTWPCGGKSMEKKCDVQRTYVYTFEWSHLMHCLSQRNLPHRKEQFCKFVRKVVHLGMTERHSHTYSWPVKLACCCLSVVVCLLLFMLASETCLLLFVCCCLCWPMKLYNGFTRSKNKRAITMHSGPEGLCRMF